MFNGSHFKVSLTTAPNSPALILMFFKLMTYASFANSLGIIESYLHGYQNRVFLTCFWQATYTDQQEEVDNETALFIRSTMHAMQNKAINLGNNV